MNGSAAGRTDQAASAAGRDGAGTGTPPGAPAAKTGRKTARSVRWSLGAVLARQGFQMLCAVVLARILGPQSYGVIAAATVCISLVALVLDQGLSAALIQRPEVTRKMAGATATLNLLVAGVLAAATWSAAPWVSDFFGVGQLEPLLRLLAAAIPLKALAITPRAMLSRDLLLHRVGAADIAAAATGCAAGIGAALAGAGAWSMTYQVLTTDLVCGSLLLAASRGPLPTSRSAKWCPCSGSASASSPRIAWPTSPGTWTTSWSAGCWASRPCRCTAWRTASWWCRCS